MRPAVALAPLVVLAAAVTGVALFALSRPVAPPRKVKLAVLVVFDQMRGDYLRQWRPHFRDDGFARLQRDGAWFTNCHYPYAVTTTGPGHASMLSGACPDTHGIINNTWMTGGNGVNCVQHPRYKLVPEAPELLDKDGKKAKPEAGASPDLLLSETVADVLKESTGGRARVFGLSLKDRSAILPTGKRADGAYWFYGAFGTSTYYTEKLRDNGRVHPWVTDINASRRAARWFGTKWTRFRPDLNYDALAGPDNVVVVDPFGKDFGEGAGHGQGRTFPHPLGGARLKDGAAPKIDKQYYEALATSPFGNDILLELAKACVTAEGLGSRDVPDLLVVSFSSNDLIGHAWGPDSHEVLDVTLRSDALMADLLAFLDRQVGPDRYLLAVTADHGICPLPEVARSKGVAPFAARVDAAALRKELDAHLTLTYPTTKPKDGAAAKWTDIEFPWVYLKSELVKVSEQPRELVAAEAARFLARHPSVARTFTHAELKGPVAPDDEIAVRVKRSFHPARCGDVCVVLQPYCIPGGATGTTHGAPYAYDTHVPLLVYGPGIRGGERDEPTTPQALASIFAKWLDVRRPKDAAFPLPESLE